MPYTLNGQAASIAEEPHEQNGTLYVPFAQVVEGLGGTVTWDNESKQASATIGQWTAVFTMAADTADVNGTVVQFPAPSYVEDGELYVPAEFFHNAYGYKVAVNGTDVNIAV
jgi:hypothetical protein